MQCEDFPLLLAMRLPLSLTCFLTSFNIASCLLGKMNLKEIYVHLDRLMGGLIFRII